MDLISSRLVRDMKRFLVPLGLATHLSFAEVPVLVDFQVNCAACHHLDVTTVGPSMVEMAAAYPAEKGKEFITWAKAPGKKNPKMIQMPSMAHVPDEKLALIHDYLLKATKGKKEAKRSSLFPPYKEPERKLPYVIHAFLPDTSPASVAVVLPKNLSLCWDTEACRLRYVWTSPKNRITSNMWPRKLESKPFYRETGEPFLSLKGKPRYLGYRLLKGYPEFHYRIGETEVRELIQNGPAKKTWMRTFSITSPPEKMTIDLSHEGKFTIKSDQGTLVDNVLTLTAAEAQKFTLTSF